MTEHPDREVKVKNTKLTMKALAYRWNGENYAAITAWLAERLHRPPHVKQLEEQTLYLYRGNESPSTLYQKARPGDWLVIYGPRQEMPYLVEPHDFRGLFDVIEPQF